MRERERERERVPLANLHPLLPLTTGTGTWLSAYDARMSRANSAANTEVTVIEHTA